MLRKDTLENHPGRDTPLHGKQSTQSEGNSCTPSE